MFRVPLCPSSGEQECALPHMVFCTGCDGCGCVELGRELCAHNHSHHYKCRTPYAAVHTLVLLMMGIMMPETCWDKSLIINIRLVATCFFLSLNLFFKMSRWIFLGWKFFRKRDFSENQNTFYDQYIFFFFFRNRIVNEIMWNNNGQTDRPHVAICHGACSLHAG